MLHPRSLRRVGETRQDIARKAGLPQHSIGRQDPQRREALRVRDARADHDATGQAVAPHLPQHGLAFPVGECQVEDQEVGRRVEAGLAGENQKTIEFSTDCDSDSIAEPDSTVSISAAGAP